MCDAQNISLVIESGRSNGYSTECLGHDRHSFKAISIEISPREEQDERIAKACDVTLLTGNGVSMIRFLTSQYSTDRIALLLDGPKGSQALQLFDKVKKHIAFAAFHDISKKIEHPGELVDNPSRPLFENRGAWFTDNEAFLDEWAWMDKHAWSDKYKSREAMTYAGFTLAFLEGGQWQ